MPAKNPGRYRARELRRYSLHRLNRTRHEGCAGFRHRVVNRDTRTFVQDLDAEDLGRAHRAVLIRAGEGHVEREHLVRIGRQGQLVQAVDVRDLGVELVDRVTNRETGVANDAGGEQSVGVGRVERELRTDLVNVGDVAATGLVEEVEQRMTAEVQPDQVAGDAALVTRIRTRVRGAHGVDGCLLASDGIGDRLEFRELELADDGLDVRSSEAVVGRLW